MLGSELIFGCACLPDCLPAVCGCLLLLLPAAACCCLLPPAAAYYCPLVLPACYPTCPGNSRSLPRALQSSTKKQQHLIATNKKMLKGCLYQFISILMCAFPNKVCFGKPHITILAVIISFIRKNGTFTRGGGTNATISTLSHLLVSLTIRMRLLPRLPMTNNLINVWTQT